MRIHYTVPYVELTVAYYPITILIMCRNIDDYNPYLYQQWAAGLSDTQPSTCDQICPDTDSEGLLSLTCISCASIPQMSRLSIFWQVPYLSLCHVLVIVAKFRWIYYFIGLIATVSPALQSNPFLKTLHY